MTPPWKEQRQRIKDAVTRFTGLTPRRAQRLKDGTVVIWTDWYMSEREKGRVEGALAEAGVTANASIMGIRPNGITQPLVLWIYQVPALSRHRKRAPAPPINRGNYQNDPYYPG